MQEDTTTKVKASFRNHLVVFGIMILCSTFIILGLLAMQAGSSRGDARISNTPSTIKTEESKKSAFGGLSNEKNSGSSSGKSISSSDSLIPSTENSTIIMYYTPSGEEFLYSYSGEVIEINYEKREVTLVDKSTGNSSKIVISEEVTIPLPFKELTEEEILAMDGKDPTKFDINTVSVGDYLQYVKYFESVIVE